jgi:hypothetical protein
MEDVGTILPKAFKKHLSCPTPRVLEVLAPLWSRIVGKLIAQHSRPTGFNNGILILAAFNPPWTTQLSQMAEQIRAQVNSFLAASVVRKIRVRCQPALGPVAPAAAHADRSLMATRLVSSTDEVGRLLWVDGTAALDADLVAVVERSFIKYFSRNGKGQDACL